MRKPYHSPGQDEKLILLYCPGRGLNSRPPAHRSYRYSYLVFSIVTVIIYCNVTGEAARNSKDKNRTEKEGQG